MPSVASRSVPGRVYEVQDGVCPCPSWTYRRRCRHIAEAEERERIDNEQLERSRAAMKGQEMTTTKTLDEQIAQLRAEFPPEQISKLPRATTKDGQKGTCPECRGYHVLPAIHLDYVGHAEVTARLLEVDPMWNWEPMAVDEHGLPALVYENGHPVGMWIKLTVCGITRLGFGSVTPGGNDPEKQLISDAIRNAAMRFGVALQLWAKTDLAADDAPERPQPRQNRAPAAKAPLRERMEPDLDNWNRIQELMGERLVRPVDIAKAMRKTFSAESVDAWCRENNATVEDLIDLADPEGK